MAISIFPSTAAEFVSNNFVIDMNDTSNNSVTLENVKQAGTYNISVESGETSFDIYLLDNDGALVAYTNTTTVAATGLFQIVVVLGVADSEIISFSYAGNVNNADGEGDQPGAAAYLTSITPSDLPSIDDTATVAGGNFGADTEIKFESGATVLDAKNIVVTNSTSLVVTRPDNLDTDLDPWTLRAITTGVPQPTATNANILTDAVTTGAVPSWVTTSPLATGTIGEAYTDTLEATDADGAVTYTVTAGSLPTGLSLNSSTGEISGTPTAEGQTFTVAATDDGGNQTTREFTLPIQLATGGTVSQDSTHIYHTFTSSDSISLLSDSTTYEYLLIAGGGASREGQSSGGGGGAGAGGLLSGTLPQDDYTITIGAGGTYDGGSQATNGSDSEIVGFATATGGGFGPFSGNGNNGGSGSGGAGRAATVGGSGIVGQGNDGGDTPSSAVDAGAGGGGAGLAGVASSNGVTGGAGGDGVNTFSAWATATGLVFDGGFFAGGGGGGSTNTTRSSGGAGGGGAGGIQGSGGAAEFGEANSGGGGGGGGTGFQSGGNGGSGLVIVRYAI